MRVRSSIQRRPPVTGQRPARTSRGRPFRGVRCGLLAVLIWAGSAGAETPGPAANIQLDLSSAFGTRSAWRFTASQDPAGDDPVGSGQDTEAGLVHLCLRNGESASCDGQLLTKLTSTSTDDFFAEPHYLNKAEIVHLPGPHGRPLLLVETASVHSGDGDQSVLFQVLAYAYRTDRFVRVYSHSTGVNNNQSVRYLAAGPLAGDVVSAEPTSDAPFGFWISVNAFSSVAYRQVLRFRSATGYGDGNPLAVVDSELPNIERRLGVWHAGSPLPLPPVACPKPHLLKMELWCG